MLAGRLDGSVDGRPITLTTEGATATLALDSLSSAWRARRSLAAVGPLLRRAHELFGIQTRARVPGLGTIHVAPRRGLLGRLMARGF